MCVQQPTLPAHAASIESRAKERTAMKRHRVWIEIVLLGTTIACVVALLIATVGAAAGAAVGMT